MPAFKSRHSLLLLTALWSALSAAQELTLFEPVDAAAVEAQQAQPQFIMNQNGQPAFTVRGTVRVGDSYQVSIVNREGIVKNVSWRAGERIGVPGAESYEILDVQARSVTLLHPSSDPCIESPSVGVRCTNPTQAVLSLATAAPLPPTSNQPAPNPDFDGPQNGFNNGAPQNPFEAAIQAQQAQQGAMAIPAQGGQASFVDSFGQTNQVPPEVQAQIDARGRARAQRLGQFQPNRIPDDQIPQGMRRVTTPFGDRLIPIRE